MTHWKKSLPAANGIVGVTQQLSTEERHRKEGVFTIRTTQLSCVKLSNHGCLYGVEVELLVGRYWRSVFVMTKSCIVFLVAPD